MFKFLNFTVLTRINTERLAMSRGIGTIFAGLLLFAGGVVTGLLIAPGSGKENRDWLQDNTKEAKRWAEKQGSRLIEEGEKKLSKVSGDIKKTVRKTIPDLYEATADIMFDDDDFGHD